MLTGTEIKSIRAGKANIDNAYARIEKGEAWLIGAHIAEYAQGNRNNHPPTRTRKLLLAVGRGKKLHDKRETEKQRDWSREKGRLLKERG